MKCKLTLERKPNNHLIQYWEKENYTFEGDLEFNRLGTNEARFETKKGKIYELYHVRVEKIYNEHSGNSMILVGVEPTRKQWITRYQGWMITF